jgi:co-chaperonin GroES (HSP10)
MMRDDSLTALHDFVILKKEKRFESVRKLGRLYLPETSNLSPREAKIGRIVSVGLGTNNKHGELVPIDDLKVGDLCYYARYGSTKFTTADGSKYIRHNEQAILAKVDEVPDGMIDPDVSMIHPRYDRMLVKPSYSFEAFTASGLIVYHDVTKEIVSVLTHEVLCVGPGRFLRGAKKFVDMTVVPGNTVWANLLSGAIITLWVDGATRQEYRLLSEGDVLLYG